ncbi:hypothetical protein P154DRAFT_137974 [Amniculicola lignicola CBS 123094]|uniref:Uncharacterized protein n=1 Tax=Amniculicola lignicola CBS 123094 TaxID=1392246 RepID=A0A6A5VVX1_9PLEO|nr:hypothetical protein P154DRAFT_137974 [Amniculicola lignicola CBS 123094]
MKGVFGLGAVIMSWSVGRKLGANTTPICKSLQRRTGSSMKKRKKRDGGEAERGRRCMQERGWENPMVMLGVDDYRGLEVMFCR